jgi:hypothetical protein
MYLSGLTDEDRTAIESCRLDPACKPTFSYFGAGLRWADEIPPPNLTRAGRIILEDLIIARSEIHRGNWPSKDDICGLSMEVWVDCRDGGLQWIGFDRIVLSEEDRQFLEDNLAAENRW